MNSFKGLVPVILAGLFAAGIAAGAQTVSVEKGKSLFNDPRLGTTGKSCNDCHPNGNGVEKAAGKQGLDSIVNACITVSLKGKALDVKSPEMKSLILYINSVGGSKPQQGKPVTGC